MTYAVEQYWNADMFKQRVEGAGKLIGFPPAAPIFEMELYQELLEKGIKEKKSSDPTILVMGMTVAVRQVAHSLSRRVTCIDISQGAIEVLGPAIPSEQNEKLLYKNWFELPSVLNQPLPDVIVGDGIFCTMQSITESRKLLQHIKNTVSYDGAVVLRVMLYPEEFKQNPLSSSEILRRYRTGAFDAEEFRFAMRLWGFTDVAYDDTEKMLNCGVAFEACKKMVSTGDMSDIEYEEMNKTYYTGKNFVPTQKEWEILLTEQGFQFEVRFLTGKHWFQYFPLYYLRVAN